VITKSCEQCKRSFSSHAHQSVQADEESGSARSMLKRMLLAPMTRPRARRMASSQGSTLNNALRLLGSVLGMV